MFGIVLAAAPAAPAEAETPTAMTPAEPEPLSPGSRYAVTKRRAIRSFEEVMRPTVRLGRAHAELEILLINR